MLIKRKSLLVIFISSIVVCIVLVLTLVAYLIYIEFKREESRRSYNDMLKRVTMGTYPGYHAR